MMLIRDKIISVFLIDGVLQGIGHKEDMRKQVRESEIILTAIVSSMSFYDNYLSVL